MVLTKKVGDFVNKDEEILKVYLNHKDVSISEILSCFEIGDEPLIKPKLILDIIK